MKPVQFDLDASFESLQSRDSMLKFETATHVGKTSYDLSGPHQPSMTPTESVEFGYEKRAAKNDDPNWNT